MSNLMTHARNELQGCGYKLDGTDEPYNKAAVDAILALIALFSEQGHSGFSGTYCINAFKTLANFEPLGPLTGADAEWCEVQDGTMWQNRRCGHVFKDAADGPAYDSQAVVFEEPDGVRFTGRYSRQFITFPYSPRSATAKVPADATDIQKEMLASKAWAATA